MPHPLIEHSDDLLRLKSDGYAVSIQHSHLVIDHIPFVNTRLEIEYGTMISELSAQGSTTLRPNGHTVFSTLTPYDSHGEKLTYLILDENANNVAGHAISCQFSNTPGHEPENYYDKITHYIDLIVPQAQAIDSTVTARVYNPADSSTDDVFHYIDSNTSRANTGKYAALLSHQKIGIVGLGGTGSYVLDLIAKTPVREIHLYDNDDFGNHNAFRSPGAATIDELNQEISKVRYLHARYDAMRKSIIPHEISINTENLSDLYEFDFIFLCIDNVISRKLIADGLVEHEIPFIDVGITVEAGQLGLSGVTRVTAVYPGSAEDAMKSLPAQEAKDNAYSSNIQTADVNMLNASLAVIEWKRWSGFYFKARDQYELITAIDSSLSTVR